MLIDGKEIAARLIAELKTKLAAHPIEKFVGAVLVGDNAASLNFLKQKEKVAKELGIDFRLYRYDADITTDKLREEIGRLARVSHCGGFIVQLPLPESVNRHYALNAIPKEKDVDCLSESALGAFYTSRGKIAPPAVGTVEAILTLRLAQGQSLRDLTAVVIGTGFLIGKPVGFWLQNRVGELKVLDSKVKNLHAELADADIIVSGAGQAGLFGAKHLKEDALVIDFGYSKTGGKITGDFDSSSLLTTPYSLLAISYTPTPGGTGPILVAKLYQNFYQLNS